MLLLQLHPLWAGADSIVNFAADKMLYTPGYGLPHYFCHVIHYAAFVDRRYSFFATASLSAS